MPLVDEEGSARTINFDWLCASPRTRLFALKSAYKFHFRHNGVPPTSLPAGEERKTKSLPCQTLKVQKTSSAPSTSWFEFSQLSTAGRTRREAQAPPFLRSTTAVFARATRGDLEGPAGGRSVRRRNPVPAPWSAEGGGKWQGWRGFPRPALRRRVPRGLRNLPHLSRQGLQGHGNGRLLALGAYGRSLPEP